MTPRDRLQRLLFEHRTAHDPASSEREILAMFEAMQKPREQMVDADGGVPSEMDSVPHNRQAAAANAADDCPR